KHDPPCLTCRPRIDRQRESAFEQDVALDAHAEGKLHRLHLRKAEGTELGLAEIGETEQGIAVLVELGREPGADAERVEELYQGHVGEAATATVGEQALVQSLRKQDHATLRSSDCSSSDSWASGRKPRM